MIHANASGREPAPASFTSADELCACGQLSPGRAGEFRGLMIVT